MVKVEQMWTWRKEKVLAWMTMPATGLDRSRPRFSDVSPCHNHGEGGLYDFAVSGLTHRFTCHNLVQAVSEGQALSEYQPWRDGTTIPSQGSLKTLHEIRQTVMDPWPEEISRAKDECTRILHRMREQLNIVINLQSKSRGHTCPSFLLTCDIC